MTRNVAPSADAAYRILVDKDRRQRSGEHIRTMNGKYSLWFAWDSRIRFRRCRCWRGNNGKNGGTWRQTALTTRSPQEMSVNPG